MSKKTATKIYEYLKRTLRPENVQGLVNNLDDCKKAEITKALNSLMEEEKVIECVNGKTKVYYLNQKLLKQGITENVGELDQKKLDEQESLKSIEISIREQDAKLAVYVGRSTRSKLLEERQRLLKSVEEAEKQLQASTAKKQQQENKAKKYDYEKVSSECRKRKRITKDIIDCIEEHQSKPKKKILEEIGIEFYN